MTDRKLIGETLTGLEFNKQVNGPFYKVLAEDMQHYDFKYQDGLNIDHRKFNPTGECEPGGLYFANELNIAYFLTYGTKIGLVIIPDDALVYIEHRKYKADKIIITKITPISNLRLWTDDIWRKWAVILNPDLLKYVPKPTYEFCLALVQQNGLAIEFVPHKYKKRGLCMAAVSVSGIALKYVPTKKRTLKMCLAAVKNTYLALHYINEQTPEICLTAVRNHYLALKYIDEQTPEICLEAVKQDGFMLNYVHEQTPEICLAAVKQNKCAVQFVKELTPEIYEAARCEWKMYYGPHLVIN